jgi:hypothetical protein
MCSETPLSKIVSTDFFREHYCCVDGTINAIIRVFNLAGSPEGKIWEAGTSIG